MYLDPQNTPKTTWGGFGGSPRPVDGFLGPSPAPWGVLGGPGPVRQVSQSHTNESFVTPKRAASVVDDQLRYLTVQNRAEKQSPKDLIDASRKILHQTLLNSDRRDLIESIESQCVLKQSTLQRAQDRFAEDLQKFQAMQFEMNTMDQLKQEDIQREVDRNERLIIELAQLNLEKDQID